MLLFLRAFSYLPLPLMYFLGIAIGEVIYRVYGSRRYVAKTNLSACFPDYPQSKINRLARRHFHSMIVGVMAMTVAWWASPERLKRLSTVPDRHTLDNIIASGKNVIFLAPHFVSLEYLGGFLFSQMEMSSMYQKNKNPYLERVILERRTRFGSRMYDYKEVSTSMIKSIRQGMPFYYLPDQDPGQRRGVFAPFFNIQTSTYPSLNKISKLGKASVIPVMARIRKYGLGFEIMLDDPLENYPVGDDIADATTMNRAIEKLISYAPEQYFWSHKRFKTRPPGEEPFY